jgi:hypothetical protein
VYWSVGVNSPGVAVGVSNGGYPFYVAPAPVYMARRPIYYQPPPPGYYYGGRGHRHGHRDHGGRGDRWDR